MLTFRGEPDSHEPEQRVDEKRSWAFPNPDEIASHCQLKAQAVRWVAERHRLRTQEGDFTEVIAANDRDFIANARDIGTFLWMIAPKNIENWDDNEFDTLAQCYEAVAEVFKTAGELERDAPNHRDLLEKALPLLAEAQSALRSAISQVTSFADQDRNGVFLWLQEMTSRHRVFIERYMKLEHLADPKNVGSIRGRHGELLADYDSRRESTKNRKKLLGAIRYHARRIQENFDECDWTKVLAIIEQLVEQGEPPSSVEIREPLLPIYDRFAENESLPPGVAMVAREIRRFLAVKSEEVDDLAGHDEVDETEIPEVRQVAELLEGKTIVVIGGEERAEAKRALERAFHLANIDWVATRAHQSNSPIEHHVVRPQVDLVLLLIRFSSHSFADVKEACDRHGKLFVRLPYGYGPNQVAVQILQQVGERLRKAKVEV